MEFPTLSKILTIEQLLELLEEHPRIQKVIQCHGCFDTIHPGHVRHLSYAKSKADILVVSVTSDRFINKGIYRPHIPQQLRAETIAAFEMVDYVIVDDNETPLNLITKIKPDYFAKGFEYGGDNSATKAETRAVESYGGEMVFTPGDIVYSSTKILEKYSPKLGTEKLISMMDQFKIEFDDLSDTINSIKDIKVHVIGDSIIDTYTRTTLIGSNAKTPTFSVLYHGHEDYIGGAAIVAEHLKAAGAKVIFTSINRVTKKNTIICGDSRLLKIDTVDNTPITPKQVENLASAISGIPADCVVFSDFRHGIFHKGSIPQLTAAIPNGIFKVADSQVASRWGNITEFKGFDLITPNEKEARFALADQDSNIGKLITATKETAQAKNIIMKLGAKGSFFLEHDTPYSVDSFVTHVKDAVGAGDALLAYSTLAMIITKSLPIATILGSIAAACECEIDGNVPITPKMVTAKLSEIEKMI